MPDLSGRWTGVYFYPVDVEMNPDNTMPATPFDCVIADTAGELVGRTTEPDLLYPGLPEMHAAIEGHHHDGRVTFTKTPDGSRQTHTIDYVGTISGDGNAIDGRWIIYGAWEGTFRMQRRMTRQEASTDRFATVQD